MTALLRICVTRRAGDVHACLKGQRGTWGCGPSADAAVGDLVRAHAEEFNVEILGPEGAGKPEGNIDAGEHPDDLLGAARDAFRRATRIMLDWPTPDAQEAARLAAVALRKVAEAHSPHLRRAVQVYLDQARAAVEQVTRNWEIAKIRPIAEQTR